jgi:pyruvate/2-oxoglutarate/acetoin dehydrogenase E1 component
MAKNLRETIKEITTHHLSKGNKLYGQCLTAVGWVNGTVPELTEEQGITELSMADVMAGGIVTGAALAGERPIFVCRYQGFQWFNAPIIANYAGKSKDIWGISCPIFIRSIAMEGGIGPVAGSSHHGIFYRMPGVKIAAPMTPVEYEEVYNTFIQDDVPYYISEHRRSYECDYKLEDIEHDNPDICLFPFSISRFECIKAAAALLELGIKVNVYHQLWIRPLSISSHQKEGLNNSKYGGIVLDDDYPNGIAKQVAYELMIETNKPVRALGLKEKTAGFQPEDDNFPPTAIEIQNYITKIIQQ